MPRIGYARVSTADQDLETRLSRSAGRRRPLPRAFVDANVAPSRPKCLDGSCAVVNWTEDRLKRVKLLHKEGCSASVIAGKLGAAFSKGIVLRKLREFEAERLRRAEMRAARKTAKARELARMERARTPPS